MTDASATYGTNAVRPAALVDNVIAIADWSQCGPSPASISGAENIYPAEVEKLHCSDILLLAEVAVIGVPDDQLGESIKSVVVVQAGKTATAAVTELVAYCRERIANLKVPKSLDFSLRSCHQMGPAGCCSVCDARLTGRDASV
jgi:acyl-CoA synthetase (AMP-forming)/AMP-acid ligase II